MPVRADDAPVCDSDDEVGLVLGGAALPGRNVTEPVCAAWNMRVLTSGLTEILSSLFKTLETAAADTCAA